jgi:hypothetical protein
MAVTPTFGRGGESAGEADDALSASRGGNFRKVHYLPKIGKNKSIFIRYILDSPDWYFMNAHPSAPTKNKPSNWPEGRSYPKSMPAVCRHDKAFQAQFDKAGTLVAPAMYTDCYICDSKMLNEWGKPCNPVVRVWTIACIREEVIGTDEMVAKGVIKAEQVGKRVGFKDATREIEEVDAEGKLTGKKTIEPALIVVNQAVSNFFGGLQAMFGIFKTVCDRDYVLLQKDEKKDVDYQHIHMDETPNHKPGTPSWDRYTQAIKDQGIDLPAMLTDRSSDDFFATFFDPNKEPVIKVKKGEEAAASPAGAPATQQSAAPSNDPDPAMLQAMRDRVRGVTSTQDPAGEASRDTAQDAPVEQSVAAGTIDFSS